MGTGKAVEEGKAVEGDSDAGGVSRSPVQAVAARLMLAIKKAGLHRFTPEKTRSLG